VSLESPRRVRLNRAYFTIFRAKVWKILIFEWILIFFWKFKKIGFGRKNQSSPQFVVHVAEFRNFSILKMGEKKECSHLAQQLH